MQPGHVVAYKKDPSLYGPMTIVSVRPNGFLECEDKHGHACGDFHPQELAPSRDYFVAPSPVKS